MQKLLIVIRQLFFYVKHVIIPLVFLHLPVRLHQLGSLVKWRYSMAAQNIRLMKFVIADDTKGGTRNLEVAKKWLKEGKKVNIVYFKKGIKHRFTSPVVFIQKNDNRIVKTDDAYYKIISFYPFVKTLYSCCFLNKTKNTVIANNDIESAKKAFKNGDIVRAETMQIITAPIVAFIDDSIFETSDGSMYMLKPID